MSQLRRHLSQMHVFMDYTRFVFAICHCVLLCTLNARIAGTTVLFFKAQFATKGTLSLYMLKGVLLTKIAMANGGCLPPLNPPCYFLCRLSGAA